MMSKQKVTFKDKKYTIMGLIQFGVVSENLWFWQLMWEFR